MAQNIFMWLSVLQGTFIIGFSFYVFSFYFPKSKAALKFDNTRLRSHVILVSVSYALITLATVISSVAKIYEFNDPWYFIVGFGYVLGDISIYNVFRHGAYKQRKKTLNEERIKELEEIILNYKRK